MHLILRGTNEVLQKKDYDNSVSSHGGGLLSALPCSLQAQPKRYYQPETEEEVEAVVKSAHEKGKSWRINHSRRSTDGRRPR